MHVWNPIKNTFILRAGMLHRRRHTVGREVSVSDVRDIQPALYWGSDRRIVRFHLDPDVVRMRGSFSLGTGWNPFVAALTEGKDALTWFYSSFQPRDLTELYFLNSIKTERGSTLPPGQLPWIAADGSTYKRTTLFHGPAGADQIDAEARRVRALEKSIRKQGYRADIYGDVSGYFLKRGSELRFMIKGGTHRAAVACALGLARLPVTFKPNWPRMIDIDDVGNWPLVASGDIGKRLAEAIFSRYFELDGTQQRAGIAASDRGRWQLPSHDR